MRERPIIDWLLDNNCRILVPRIVEREILAGQGKYSDAKIAAERLKVNEIEVFDVSDSSSSVLSAYGLGSGEQGVMLLAFSIKSMIDYVILDDKLAYIVSDRVLLPKLFLLDLILEMAFRDILTADLVKEICHSVSPRYSQGMIEHTLLMLEKGERKWLK